MFGYKWLLQITATTPSPQCGYTTKMSVYAQSESPYPNVYFVPSVVWFFPGFFGEENVGCGCHQPVWSSSSESESLFAKDIENAPTKSSVFAPITEYFLLLSNLRRNQFFELKNTVKRKCLVSFVPRIFPDSGLTHRTLGSTFSRKRAWGKRAIIFPWESYHFPARVADGCDCREHPAWSNVHMVRLVFRS